jgi:hypothetical protein
MYLKQLIKSFFYYLTHNMEKYRIFTQKEPIYEH